ncbi:unnamed protein product [Bursaphelenchus xylophilus]|uniref:(pine wood nematode) hypothetical protein n=1 Tax=Bursaphelenchus xylophilus TaxID=6326 RepID=A0A1I7RUU8_BURXY|nr:unnamed protein product [Bursaphelenchus xylophilus]CAG9105421.1 unnamed protein product [Bursaphelenchus xylophilus]
MIYDVFIIILNIVLVALTIVIYFFAKKEAKPEDPVWLILVLSTFLFVWALVNIVLEHIVVKCYRASQFDSVRLTV